MTLKALFITGFILLLLVILPSVLGLWLMWPFTSKSPDRFSDLGTSLAGNVLGGAVIAFSVLFLEQQLSRRQRKRDLQLQLSAETSFSRIDLKGRDLSGLYLPGKDFLKANFEKANLRGAILSGVDFTLANLASADLRGAKLDGIPLYPSEDLYPSEKITPGIERDAIFNQTTLLRAKYDSSTTWPKGINPRERGAIEVVEKRAYYLFLLLTFLLAVAINIGVLSTLVQF